MWFKSKQDLLGAELWRWGKYDPFLAKDLLRSIAIIGGSGSGKTTGPGYYIAKNIAHNPLIVVMILASKPEDREFWEAILKRAHRELLVFGPDSPFRFNGIDFIQQSGGDTRDITQAILTVGELLERGGNVQRQDFWERENGVMIHHGVEIVKGALGRMPTPALEQFILTAPLTPDAIKTEAFRQSFHFKCMIRAKQNARTPIQLNDYVQAFNYWGRRFPAMADKMRSGIITGVMGILFALNNGIVKALMSQGTNISPANLDQGQSILIDMPISQYGPSGAAVLGLWKHIVQWRILRRKVTENTPICVIWSDEYQKVVTGGGGGDPAFLAESRSHRGCMVVLTQSLHALYTKLQMAGEHEADSLWTNFYTKIGTSLGDSKSAEYFSALVGKRLTTRIGGSVAPCDNVYDALFGNAKFTGSFSTHMENILEPRAFMHGLRTGGPENGYMVDGYVLRSGEAFSNGENYLKVSFSQRG